MKNTKKSLIFSVISLVLCFSMLVGTTFAWFTDSVSSANNIITAGNLDVKMYWSDDMASWNDIEGENNKVFNYDNWEPGYTEVKYLKIQNNGSLAFKYQLNLLALGEVGKLAEVIDVYYGISPEAALANRDLSSLTKRDGTLKELIGGEGKLIEGVLLPAGKTDASYKSGEIIVAIALHMQESAGNEYQKKSVGDGFTVQLLATQYSFEGDSFGSDYDADAEFPAFNGNYNITVDVSGKLDSSNKLTENVTIGNSTDKVRANVPEGAEMAPGVTELALAVKTTERSDNIEMTLGQVSRSLDVHIEGLAEGNTVPVVIDLGAVLPIGYKAANIALYHVEDGVANKMNLVDVPTLHNDFSYNAETGEVSVALASFSEVTAVVAAGDPWDGVTKDTSWYNANDTEFTLTTEDQFAGFAAIVGGMASGIEQDTFAGKTVKLGADLDLGSKNGKIFTPVGYFFTDDYSANGTPNENKADIYSTVYSFEGTFDGQNHTIANILQRTWDIKGDDPHYSLPAEQYYNDGMGIFGFVYNGTVKNLVVSNFQSDGEYSTTGCVAAYTSGNSTFENIKVVNSNPRAYNVPNGGVVGYAYNQSGSTDTVNFNNITVDSSNKITALWGSWDVGCGGILGRVNGDTTINMTNCTVGAVIDVYNDVCGNYQYYQYRYAGMLVGTVGGDTDPLTGGEKVNFSNVKVYIGNWADYYYCEFEKNSVGSYTEDFQFSRVEKNEINIDPTTNLPYTQNLSPCRHQHTANEDKMGTYLPFDQLYTGYGWGSSPVKSADGVEIIKYFYTVKYMDGKGENVLATEYVTEGERSETKLWANAHTVKVEEISENPGKIFKGWVNADSAVTTSISAGNYKDVVLYESWDNPFVARFVDKDGKVIYSETFMRGDTTISEPEVPEVEGYVGEWESYQGRINALTGDITIKPIYVLKEYVDQNPDDNVNENNHVHLDPGVTAEQLFTYLGEGKSVIMGGDLTHTGSNLNGGTNNLCNIDTTTARLNLNSYKLTCDFSHNANKKWHVFGFSNNSKLTISGGVNDDGVLFMNLKNMNGNASANIFALVPNSTLILEAGVTIEIRYPKVNKVNAFAFLNGNQEIVKNFEKYDGVYVQNMVDSSDNNYNIIRIIVGVTSTIEYDGTNIMINQKTYTDSN